tara:strand:+ start:5137 stop:6285 length:1149 start_codon:yes stop_codon:yes gene_type:complete
MSAILLKKSLTDSLNELEVPTFTESGTRRSQDVSVTNTPSVTVSGTATVSVSNTPSVTVSGTADVRLKDPIGFAGTNTQFGEVKVAKIVRQVGAQFSGSTIDPSFWVATVANSATVVQQNNDVDVSSGTNTAGSARFHSARRARYISGVSNGYRAVVHLSDTGVTGNTRKWGIGFGASMPTITDGAYFKLSGTTFSVCTLKGGVETAVDSGSFNGTSTTYTPVNTAITCEIFYAQSSVVFVINNVRIHTVTAASSVWTNVIDLHVYTDSINSGSTTNCAVTLRAAAIRRFGEETSHPTFRNITTATTTILKYSSGTLQTILIGNPTNNAITIYDNTAASGTIITIINPGAIATPLCFNLNVPFQNGLTVVTAGTPNLTLIYE